MTTRSCSLYGFDEGLTSNDRDLFSLFLQYPEIDFDVHSDDQNEPDNPATSDITSAVTTGSQAEDDDKSTLVTQMDSSPTLTTPYRTIESTPDNTNDRKCRTWSRLQDLMQQSDLPPECLHYYTSLAEGFVLIGTDQFETARPGKSSDVWESAQRLLKSMTYSCEQAKIQVERVAELKTLVAFNVKPAPGQVWSTYQQRSKLITQKLALPSKRELDILEALVVHFDSWVYHDFLQMYSIGAVEDSIGGIMNEMYDKIMTWWHNYKLWCCAMQDLRCNYMQSLVVEFKTSKEAQEDYTDFQLRLGKARSSLARSIEETAKMTEAMVQNLNLSARRPGQDTSLKRSRTRYKREHTL